MDVEFYMKGLGKKNSFSNDFFPSYFSPAIHKISTLIYDLIRLCNLSIVSLKEESIDIFSSTFLIE
jgi:hypothetical protein